MPADYEKWHSGPLSMLVIVMVIGDRSELDQVGTKDEDGGRRKDEG